VNYLKELFDNSSNYYIKEFIEYLDDYISKIDEDFAEVYLNDIYINLSSIISLKIEESIYEDICSTIDEIVKEKESVFQYQIDEEECVVENMSEINALVIKELCQVIEEKISDEVDDYMLYNIEFKSLDVNSENCYDYSYIEQSVIDNIYSINKVSKENLSFDDKVTIHDVFSQEYKEIV